MRLSRQLVRVIRQSIYLFAFGMNALGMLLGAVGILEPAAAAVFHECASLAVMLNAMRLLWFERWQETRLGQYSNSLAEMAQWLTETFSPTQIVFRLLSHWALLLRLGTAAVVMVWCLSGIVLISEHEQALVTRFGSVLRNEQGGIRLLSAGLHWRWPCPLENIVRDKTDRIRSVQLGFRSRAFSSIIRPGWIPDY